MRLSDSNERPYSWKIVIGRGNDLSHQAAGARELRSTSNCRQSRQLISAETVILTEVVIPLERDEYVEHVGIWVIG